MTVAERFWAKVDKSGECWLWTGAVDGKGYGKLYVDGKFVVATRLSMRLAGMALEPGQDACHRCDTPSCVRPDHLFAGSRAENMADAKAKGRMSRGVDRWCAKLTEADVVAIRAATGPRGFLKELAARYGVTQSVITLVRQRKKWAWLEPTDGGGAA